MLIGTIEKYELTVTLLNAVSAYLNTEADRATEELNHRVRRASADDPQSVQLLRRAQLRSMTANAFDNSAKRLLSADPAMSLGLHLDTAAAGALIERVLSDTLTPDDATSFGRSFGEPDAVTVPDPETLPPDDPKQ